MKYETIMKRISNYGFTPEEAVQVPLRKPLWMWRIEQEEGRELKDIVAETACAAGETGYTLSDLARELEINRHTLGFWARKWGIKFPVGCSSFQKEVARQQMVKFNRERAV